MNENGEIYTAGKNFTLTALTNSTSDLHCTDLLQYYIIYTDFNSTKEPIATITAIFQSFLHALSYLRIIKNCHAYCISSENEYCGWAPKMSSTNRLYDYILSYLYTTLCVNCLKAASNNHIIVSILYFDGNQQEGSDIGDSVIGRCSQKAILI